jgi:ELWxxDGT repeat protein
VFAATDGTNATGTGREPWVSDGTAAGTRLLKDVHAGIPDSSPEGFVALDGRVLFTAFDGAAAGIGRELWLTDGTPGGTLLLRDVWPGRDSGGESSLGRAGENRVLFAGNDGTTGAEPWVSDGTPAGTRLVKDLLPGFGGSAPAPLGRAGNRLLLRAIDRSAGEEPFVMDLAVVGGGYADPFGAGCPGTGGRIPALFATTPLLNSTSFRFDLGNARASAPAAIWVGAGPTPLAVGGGCRLYLALSPILVFPIATDAAGGASLPLPLPNAPPLLGLLLHAQSLVADPAGAWFGLIAFSNPVQLVLGQ